MTEVYYLQNKKQYKTVIARLFMDCSSPDEGSGLGIVGCYYDGNEKYCYECECEYCRLYEDILDNLNHQNILSNILTEEDIQYPSIMVIADTYDSNEKITIIKVEEAKENTKYGVK